MLEFAVLFALVACLLVFDGEFAAFVELIGFRVDLVVFGEYFVVQRTN